MSAMITAAVNQHVKCFQPAVNRIMIIRLKMKPFESIIKKYEPMAEAQLEMLRAFISTSTRRRKTNVKLGAEEVESIASPYALVIRNVRGKCLFGC